MERIQTELEFNESQFKNYEKIQQTKLAALEEKRDVCANDINTLYDKIVGIKDDALTKLSKIEESLENDISECRNVESEINRQILELNAEINSKLKFIQQLSQNEIECPTCSREYSEEHKDHVATLLAQENQSIASCKTSKEELQALLKARVEERNKVEAKISACKSKRIEIEKKLSNNKSTELSIRHLKKNLKDIESDIESIKNEQNHDLERRISELKESNKITKIEVDKLNNELNVLETVKFIISEEGIKSFIVKKILTVLNSRIAYYLQKLEGNCLCKFNEFFDEEIIDENSQAKSYFNFSGGERKRIDLACLFAFADIRRLQGDVIFSTVFYDELLDSSLDDKGVSLTLKTLRERYTENNESCYIITHRGPEVTTKAEHTIHVVKRNGISSISS